MCGDDPGMADEVSTEMERHAPTSPTWTSSAATCATEPDGRTRRAVVGRRLRRAVMSLATRSLARSSRVLPTWTNARSIAGSSKYMCQPRRGRRAATVLTAMVADAPRDTRESMSGCPRARFDRPEARMDRPGPSMAATDMAAATAGWPSMRTAGRAGGDDGLAARSRQARTATGWGKR